MTGKFFMTRVWIHDGPKKNSLPIVQNHDGGNKISWRKNNGFHAVVSGSWRGNFSLREFDFMTDQKKTHYEMCQLMTEGTKFHDGKIMDCMPSWMIHDRGNFFITGVWIHDGLKKSMTGNQDVSWRIVDFMTWKLFSWREIHDFMTPNLFHDGKEVDFPDEKYLTQSIFVWVVGWCGDAEMGRGSRPVLYW